MPGRTRNRNARRGKKPREREGATRTSATSPETAAPKNTSRAPDPARVDVNPSRGAGAYSTALKFGAIGGGIGLAGLGIGLGGKYIGEGISDIGGGVGDALADIGAGTGEGLGAGLQDIFGGLGGGLGEGLSGLAGGTAEGIEKLLPFLLVGGLAYLVIQGAN